MSHVTKSRIIELATKAREWAVEQENIGWIYGPRLKGLCAITTARLFTMLQEAGIKAVIVTNRKHCFLTTNGYLVDVTATQFDGVTEEVVVRKVASLKSTSVPYYWQPQFRLNSVEELAMHQAELSWPLYQQVRVP